MTISNNTQIILTFIGTAITIYLTYLSEHHDSGSKRIEEIEKVVDQRIKLKGEQYQSKFNSVKRQFEDKYNELIKENNYLKKVNGQYRETITSMKKEIRYLKNKLEINKESK